MYIQILSTLVLVCALVWLLQQLRDSCKRRQCAEEYRKAELALLENTLLVEREKRERASHSAEAWSGFRKFKVARKQQEGGGICSFYLEAHDRKPIADFKPGQYLTFQMNIPDQSKPVVRCYSLSDCYRDTNYRVSIKAALPPRNVPDAPPGLASNFFHDAIEEGQIVDVRAPSGHFFFASEARRPVVLIGGGVGLTPVLSMLNHLSQEPGDREVWFFYGVSNGEEHILRDEMEAAANRSSNIRLVFCYSKPTKEDEVGGNVVAGRISIDLFKEKLGTNNYDFYICGPGPLMESMINGLREWGVPDENVYFETFGPSSVKKTRPSIPLAEASTDKKDLFTVEFRKSGKTATWDGSCENLLELAESEDVSMACGCRAGSCGSCQVAVISGKVKYPQSPDHDPEVGTCLTCVGQPSENLVIDA